jgi:TolA-binding protein
LTVRPKILNSILKFPNPQILIFALFALAGVGVSAHAFSVSYAHITIGDRTVDAVVRLPMDDIDLLLRLDRDLDGRVSAPEIQAARGALSSYFVRHFHAVADGVALTPAVSRLTTWRDASGFEYLEAELTVDAGRRLRLVSIRSDYLTELYPAHSTQADIAAGGRTDRFVFRAGATYERRVADAPWTALAIALGAAAILALLWFARRPRRHVALAAAMLLAATAARADVIMTAPGLNATLKTMERLTKQAANGPDAQRAEATFQLAVQADALATLMNDEVASHGMGQRELLDLALSRTKELGIAIAYNRDKKKFFYDGAAFRQYLASAPHGTHAANAEFTLLAYQFYQSDGTDVEVLQSGVEAKKRFLARYPKFKADPELSLYLAVDYSDLYRRYRDAHDAAAAERYRLLTRAEYQRIARQYPGTEQAQSARQLLRRFDEETRPHS